MKHCLSVALLLLAGCNLYEGRSLDLFPPGNTVLVECREDRDCDRDRPYCAGGSCVSCRVDDDCERRRPACVGNACVECRSAENCGPGQACNSALNECAQACSVPGDCTGPALAQCSPALGVCVQCAADVDCREPKDRVCGLGGRCVPCREEESCATDAGPPEPMPMPPAISMSMPDAMPTPPAPAPMQMQGPPATPAP